EPNAWARAELLANLELNRIRRRLAAVEVVPSEAGAEASTAVLGSVDLEAHAAQASLHSTGKQSIEVPVVRLDDAVSGPVDLLKIDVEGHELAVLDGADRLLRTSPPRCLVIEVHGGNLARAGHAPEQLVSRVESLGYA